MKEEWRRTPDRIRRPIVLVVGGFFVLLSGLVGWLPGPGGLPIFLLGITILASEFLWAERLRNWLLARIADAGRVLRRHWASVAVACIGLMVIIYLIYNAYF